MTKIQRNIVKIFVANLAVCLAACGGPSASTIGAESAVGAPDEQIASSKFAEILCANPEFPLLAVETNYQGILQRNPDEGGLNDHAAGVARDGLTGWLNDIRTFIESDEFKDGILANQSNRDILERLYLGYLKRPLDTTGAKIFLRLMNEKGVLVTARALATSDEYFNKIFPFASIDRDRHSRIVTKIYQAMLGRAPSAAETELSANDFGDRGLRGVYDAIERISGTEEHARAIAQAAGAVAGRYFSALLGRAPTADESKRAVDLIGKKDHARAAFEIAAGREFLDKTP